MNRKKLCRSAAAMTLVCALVSGTALAAPADLMGHDSLYIWDYHLTNYDNNGNIRVSPDRTTFAPKGEQELSSIPAYYSPNAILKETDGGGYGVSGSVEIFFSYMSEDEKAWVDAISSDSGNSVQLVSFDENKRLLNDALQYTLEKDVSTDNETRTAAKLMIPLGQTNFYTNGRYYVRVRAAGKEPALVPIHVVNEKAPTIKPQLDTVWTTEPKAFFDVSDMTYGVLMPAYAAELTYPDGTVRALTVIRDWYLIGNLFVLYNDSDEALFTQLGTYTLTVHSTGFKDMSCTFEMEEGEPIPGYEDRKPIAVTPAATSHVDAVTHATSSSGGGGVGSQVMPANLLFNEDLLSNAMILNKLGLGTAATASIHKRWSEMMSGKHDAVYDADRRHGYDWQDYMNAVQRAKQAGEYLTFEAYAAHGKLNGGNPYAIKEVLEDGLLGETQMGGVYLGKRPPALTRIDASGEPVDETLVQEGEDLILSCPDATYLNAITGIMIDDHQYPRLEENVDYTINGEQLIIYGDAVESFGFGARRITLDADGYRRIYLNIVYGKDLEQNVGLEATKDEFTHSESVFVRLTNTHGDFMKHLQKVELVDPKGEVIQLLTKEQGGDSSNDWYTVSGNTSIGIQPGAFKQNGVYTVRVTAQYYGMRQTEAKLFGPLPALGLQEANGSRDVESGSYRIALTEAAGTWRLKNYKLTVNGTQYTEETASNTLQTHEFRWDSRNSGAPVLYLHPDGFTKDVNQILITLEGYSPVKILVDKVTGYAVITDGDTMPDPADPPAVSSTEPVASMSGKPDHYRIHLSGDDVAQYLGRVDAFTQVSVQHGQDTVNYTYQAALTTSHKHAFSVEDGMLLLTADGLANGENTIVIDKVGGYSPLTVTITKSETPDVSSFDPRENLPVAARYYRYDSKLNYAAYDREEVMAWMDTITALKVNNTVYTKAEYAYEVNCNNVFYVNSARQEIYLGCKTLDKQDVSIIELTDGTGTITFKLTGKFQIEFVETEQEPTPEPEGNAAPEPQAMNEIDEFYGWEIYYRLSFHPEFGADALHTYLSQENMTVTIDGKPCTKAGFSWGEGLEYRVEEDSSSLHPDQLCFMDYHEDCFKERKSYAVEITVPGYQTLTFTVVHDGTGIRVASA